MKPKGNKQIQDEGQVDRASDLVSARSQAYLVCKRQNQDSNLDAKAHVVPTKTYYLKQKKGETEDDKFCVVYVCVVVFGFRLFF